MVTKENSLVLDADVLADKMSPCVQLISNGSREKRKE